MRRDVAEQDRECYSESEHEVVIFSRRHKDGQYFLTPRFRVYDVLYPHDDITFPTT